MSIGCHALWGVTNHIDGLLEKALGCLHISLLTHQGVNQIAIAIDGPIEVAPFSLELDRDTAQYACAGYLGHPFSYIAT